MQSASVITIDGPSGSGKGTVSRMLAQKLGWAILDSGAIYRVLALASVHNNIDPENEEALVPLAANLDVQFVTDEKSGNAKIILEGEDITHSIRNEEVGGIASRVASLPRVREALLRRQRAFKQEPGLVADGRDMGTVVFPHAQLKIFLTASPEERAKRRYKQLKEKGIDANLPELVAELKARDKRDSERSAAPLKAADDAVLLDTTEMSIDEVVNQVMQMASQCFGNKVV